MLTDALKDNRQALVDAIKANDTLVKAWLRDHKDLAGIVLKGDVHVFVADVTTAALGNAGEGRRVFVLAADGNQLQVPYDAEPGRRVPPAVPGPGRPGRPSAELSPPARPGTADSGAGHPGRDEDLPDVRRGDQGGGGAVPLLRPPLRRGVIP